MMAQVPYSPVETISPSETPTPRVSAQAPLAAFGEPQAQGLTNLGNSISQASDKIFDRAVAIQHLNNETEAKEADSKYMVKASALHDDFNQLEGKAKVDGLPKYTEDVQKLRSDIRGDISNPAAQQIYDRQSLGTMAHTIMKGATAAADAHKQWTAGTNAAQIDLDTKAISDNPTDDNLFKDKLERIKSGAATASAQQGLESGSAGEQDVVTKATSRAWQHRITGLAKTSPFEAAKMLDENKKNLSDDDYTRADNVVRTQGRAVGAANIANQVFDENKSLTQMEADAEAKAKEFNKDDPILAQHAVAALQTKYAQRKYAARQDQLTAKQDVAGIVHQSQPSNMQEFLAIPGASEKYEQMSQTDQNSLAGQINRYQTAVGKPDNDKNYTRLHGMAVSNDPDAREEFLNVDPTKEDLSQTQMQRIQSIQAKMKNNTAGDPRVNKATEYLRGAMGSQLQALGIMNRTKDNAEDYDHYIGSLQSALEVWNDTHKQPATYKDITETIGPQLLKERTQSTFFGLSSEKVPFFKQDVPEEFATAARTAAKNPNLPEDQIYKLWTRMQYRNLYSKSQVKNQDRIASE